MYPRNNATPPRIAIGAVVQIADGAVQSSGVSVVVRPEGGAESAGAGTIAYSAASGVVYYTPTQAETDYTAFCVIAYKADCIPAQVTVVTTASSTAGAVELDSAVGAQITAIETFATRITTGIVQDGAVWQFTANMLELGPSGSSAITVLPATGIVADRSAGVTLTPVVGETISQALTVYRSDGTTAVNLSGKTLRIIFETMSGVDVAVVQNSDITVSGTGNNVVTFAYPSAVTTSERSLRFALRDATAPLTMYLQGICSVVAAPKADA
jgi:hypothetical protein